MYRPGLVNYKHVCLFVHVDVHVDVDVHVYMYMYVDMYILMMFELFALSKLFFCLMLFLWYSLFCFVFRGMFHFIFIIFTLPDANTDIVHVLALSHCTQCAHTHVHTHLWITACNSGPLLFTSIVHFYCSHWYWHLPLKTKNWRTMSYCLLLSLLLYTVHVSPWTTIQAHYSTKAFCNNHVRGHCSMYMYMYMPVAWTCSMN